MQTLKIKILSIKKLCFSLVFTLLTSNAFSQNNIIDNPFQLDWVNHSIDDFSSNGTNAIFYSIGTYTEDTLFQITELENGEIQSIKSFDSSSNLIQTCINENNSLSCQPISTQILLENGRDFWAKGANISCSISDSLELTRFYWTLNGPAWEKSWDLSQEKSTWENVTFYNNGCVRKILADKAVDGYLHDFHFLEIEDLSFILTPNLIGEVPNFSNMPNLELLKILGTNVHGKIPDFNKFPLLRLLTLNQSNFSDHIPDFESLPKLTNLDLSNNELTGSIPAFEKCPKLKRIDLKINQLQGVIPSFENHVDLIQLSLKSNQLIGEIPNFNNNPNLTYLGLDNNQLTGSIPGLQNCPLLKDLSLSNNKLSGNIPNFDSSHKLTDLRVRNNHLNGNIPTFENTPLERLDCSLNNLTGPVPDFSLTCPSLFYCDIFYNDFTFEHIIPTYEANLASCVSPYPDWYFGGYYYFPQNPIYKDTIFYKKEGDTLNIDLVIDDSLSTNIYTWKKNNEFHSEIIGNNNFMINNLQLSDAGIYQVEVSNPLVPDLVIHSYQITINVDEFSSIKDPLSPIIQLSPNPVIDKLNVSTSSDDYLPEGTILIMDNNGRELLNKKIRHGKKSIDIDCTGLYPGIYYMINVNQESVWGNHFIKL